MGLNKEVGQLEEFEEWKNADLKGYISGKTNNNVVTLPRCE